MDKLTLEFSLENFIKLSREFTLETGLASDNLKRVLEEIPQSSMAMLGQTVFMLSTDVENDSKRIRKYTDRISISKLSPTGAHVIKG